MHGKTVEMKKKDVFNIWTIFGMSYCRLLIYLDPLALCRR